MDQSPAEPSHKKLFEYDNIAPDEIRLLRLQTSHADGRLRFTLRPYRRQQAPRYVAISYHWGDEPPIHKIIVNGKKMYVRPYIWQALSQITTEPEALSGLWGYFWCDAICIDQANVGEKNEQIRSMRQIFASAQLVIAWLGPDYAGDMDGKDRTTLERPNWRSLFPPVGRLFGKQDIWSRELFRRPYLHRIWIVQELIAAKQVIFLLGRMRMTHLNRSAVWALHWRKGGILLSYAFKSQEGSTNSFWRLFEGTHILVKWVYDILFQKRRWLEILLLCFLAFLQGWTQNSRSERPYLSLFNPNVRGWDRISLSHFAFLYFLVGIIYLLLHNLFWGLNYDKTPDLESWLTFTKHSLCSNPKDRIFALLNLLPEDAQATLSVFFPDYDLSLERIQMITLAFLRQEYARTKSSYGLLNWSARLWPKRTTDCHELCELLNITSMDLAEDMGAKTGPDSDTIKAVLELDRVRAAWTGTRNRAKEEDYEAKLTSIGQVRVNALAKVASSLVPGELIAQVSLVKRKKWYVEAN